jgi:hypothetical protein
LDVVHAAGKLPAAVREVAHDKTTWARPEVMAGRVDLGEAAQHLQQALSTAVDVACVIRDVALQDTNLTGPAGAMSHRGTAQPTPITETKTSCGSLPAMSTPIAR